MEISVCIATYRRPGGLARLLRSLELQRGDVPAFEVIVVDNDAAGSAAAVCAGFANRLRLRHLVEPVRGIAVARNRAVGASLGRFLAFIDDDNEACPNWLASLHREAEARQADGVFGPVIYKFDKPPPVWILNCGLFDEPVFVTGDRVPWYWTRTSNAYVRRDALPDAAAPFDVGLALIGGEDVDLFARMVDRGARLFAAADACVFEHREAARLSARWLVRRSFRNGGTLAHVMWRRVRGRARLYNGADALGKSFGFLVTAARRLRSSRADAMRHGLLSVESLGKAAWTIGIVYSEYRRPS
jgi:glycosyltransferase involved in cell wall biosynthesis